MGEHEEQFIFEMGYNKGFKDGIKCSIPKDQYEARLKANMVAMLTEIQLEIEETVKEEELIDKKWANGLHYSEKIIQQKIDKLKENINDTNTD